MRGRATGRGRGIGQGAAAGGGGAVVNPIVALSPVFYWRADDDPIAAAAAITSIVDQSGNENNLANNGANNATMTAGKAGTNSKKYFKAPAGNITCEYEATGIVTHTATGVTMFVVTYFDTGAPEAGTHRLLQTHLERNFIQLDQNNNTIETYWTVDSSGANLNATVPGLYIIAGRFNSAAGGNTGARTYFNSLTAADTQALTNDVTLGAGAGDTGVTLLNDRGNSQEICEAVVFDSALSDADFATVMNELASFYGVTLA